MRIKGHQDGLDRFGITGKYTSKKHNTLSEYFKYHELHKLRTFTCVRRPIQRLISLYFSPHRALRSETHELEFNINAFYKLIKESRSCLDFLSISNNQMTVIPSNLTILRTESLAADSKRLLSLNISSIRNQSNQKELQKELALDSNVIDIIQNSHHYQDELFFYGKK